MPIAAENQILASEMLLEHNADWTHKSMALIPTNLVAHTTATSVPSGWAEYTAGRGRVVVGTPASGTHGGTVGSALTDLQAPTHTHTGPSHTHGQNLSGGGTLGGTGGVVALNATGGGMAQESGTGSYFSVGTGVTAAGTGATGATSATMPYVQLLGIEKSA